MCPELPPTTEERIADHRAQTFADSVMYREALATAAQARGWSVHWYNRERVFRDAAAALGREDIDAFLYAMGRPMGPPWQAQQKLVAAAALAATFQAKPASARKPGSSAHLLGGYGGTPFANLGYNKRLHHTMHHSTKTIEKYITQLWATALALAVCSLLTTGCHTGSLRSSEIVADSVSGFSGKQGANGWSYGYWDRSADTDKSYSQTTDFQLLRHFGSDSVNGLSSRSDFTTGKLWILQDGQYYTALWAEGGSANGTTELAAQAKVEHWAVRRWVSTVNGPVTISGHAAKILDWGDVDSGQAHIVVDGATVFSAATHGLGTNYSVNVTVHIGSLVDFLITAGPTETGGAFGPVKFTATIQAAFMAAEAAIHRNADHRSYGLPSPRRMSLGGHCTGGRIHRTSKTCA